MKALKFYFENAKGTGILATADSMVKWMPPSIHVPIF